MITDLFYSALQRTTGVTPPFASRCFLALGSVTQYNVGKGDILLPHHENRITAIPLTYKKKLSQKRLLGTTNNSYFCDMTFPNPIMDW